MFIHGELTITDSLKLAEGMEEVLTEQTRLETLGPDAAAEFWAQGAHELHAVEDFTYTGAERQPQSLRLYRATSEVRPTLIYIHGGGWVEGSIDLNESAARALAALSGRHVVSISYRFAPTHPYPAGLSDCIAAVNWLQTGDAPLEVTQHLDVLNLAIGGASAGANLALATALSLKLKTFDALLLFYGVFDDDMTVKSYREHSNGPGITRARIENIFKAYDPHNQRLTDHLIRPLHADLAGLPHTVIAAAEIDVLRSENELMAERMQKAGVDVTAWVESGVTHGYINRGRLLPAARNSLARAADILSSIRV